MAENQKLIRPGAGEQVALPVGPDAKLEFTFNPGDADLSKDGQNFVLTFQDGAKLTLEGFYDNFGDNTQPPTLVMDGQELPGEQFLAALNNPDLMPAAGPAAGPALGGGSYEDALLAGVSGVDRLDKLVFDGWGRGTEPTEQYIGGPIGETPEEPGGILDMALNSYDGAGAFKASGAFEDWRPDQHLGDYTTQAFAKIDFDFTPTGTTVVTGVHLTGFDAGTTIYVGDPNNPDRVINVGGPDETVDFDESDFTGLGVYVLPPANSDHDMNIDAVLDLRAASSDRTGTATTSFTIIVDAVADKPEIPYRESGFSGVDLEGGLTVEEPKGPQGFKDGWAVDELQKGADTPHDIVVSVPFHTRIEFGDFADGSESHYALVQVPPGEWEILNAPGAYEKVILWLDAGGMPVAANTPGATQTEFFRIEVPNNLITPLQGGGGRGTYDLDIVFKGVPVLDGGVEGTTTPTDTTVTLFVGAWAHENVDPGEQELRWDNNDSVTLAEYPAGFNVDTIDSKLTLKAGWASEGNAPGKHGGAGPNFDKMVDHSADPNDSSSNDSIDSASTHGVDGAPISLSIDNTASGAHNEAITEVEFTLPPGTLYADGTALTDGFDADVQGVHYKVDGNKVTITPVDDNDPATFDSLGSNLDSLNLVFKPAAGDFSHGDQTLGYKVTVTSGTTGAEAEFSGTTTVVIDAVADRPVGLSAGVGYHEDPTYGEQTAAKPGEAVTVKGQVTFPDTSAEGNENHYILLNLSHAVEDGWDVPGGAGNLLTQQGVYDIFTGVGGHNLSTDGALFPTNVLGAGGKEYLLVEVVPNADGSGYHAEVGGQPLAGVAVTQNNDGSFSYSVSITAPAGALHDDSATVWVKPFAVVNDPNAGHEAGAEYNYGNNISWGDVKTTTVAVSPADSTGGVRDVDTYESRDGTTATIDPNKHVSGSGERHTISGGASATIAWHNAGDATKFGDITFSLTNPAGSTVEYITELRFDVAGDLKNLGSLQIGGTAIPAWDGTGSAPQGPYYTVTGDGAGAVTHVHIPVDYASHATDYVVKFVPAAWSNADLKITEYHLDIVNSRSFDKETVGVTGSVDKPVDVVVVDAVAAKGEISTDASFVVNSQGGKGAVDYNGDQTKAKPGESVEVHLKVKVNDAGDSDEQHFIMLSTKSTGGTELTYNDVTFYDADGNAITLTVPTTVYTVDGTTYYRVEVPQGAALDAGGNLQVLVDLKAPSPADDASYTIKAGLWVHDPSPATDGLGSSNTDITLNNNNAFSETQYKVDVGVASQPSIGIENNHIFENLTPNAHENDSVSGTNKVGYADNVGATIIVGNLAANESAVATFTFSAKNPDGSSVNFSAVNADGSPNTTDVMRLELVDANGNVILDAQGDPYIFPITQGANGQWTVSITVDDYMKLRNGTDTDVVFTFKPGHNYNSSDITVDSVIKVTDTASGHEKTWGSTSGYSESDKLPVLEIDVDAVAQLPTITAIDKNVGILNYDTPEEGDYFSHAAPGGNALLRTTVTFEDYMDGSEEHYVLVQYEAGCVPHTVVIGGQEFDIAAQNAGVQNIDGNLYYKILVPNTLIKENNGSLDVEVQVKVTSDMEGTKLRIGAMAHEPALPGAKNLPEGDTETLHENNTSIVLTDPVTLHVSGADGVGLSANWIFDNDRPNAHQNTHGGTPEGAPVPGYEGLDSDDRAHGTVITLSAGANDTIDLITFTDPTAGGKGTLYYLPEGYSGPWNDASLAGYKVTGPFAPAADMELRFIPNHGTNDAADYNDVDPVLNYTINVHDTLSGAKGSPSGILTIKADAVAQAPSNVDAPADSVGTDVKHGETVSFVVEASFRDLDGSEKHYILVEAHPNTSIAAGTNYTVAGIYTHTHPDGTSTVYHKLEVNETYLKGTGGDASITVNYTTSGLDTPGDGTVKVGALAYEPSGIDNGNTELSLHNNQAFTDGGDIKINFAGGPGHISIGPVWENNTPNAHVGNYDKAYGTIDLNHPTADTVSITVPKDVGELLGAGTGVTNPDGSVTYTIARVNGEFPDVQFKVAENFSDRDVQLGYDFNTPGSSYYEWTFESGKPSSMVLYFEDAAADTPAGQAARESMSFSGLDDAKNAGWTQLDNGEWVYHVTKTGNGDWNSILNDFAITKNGRPYTPGTEDGYDFLAGRALPSSPKDADLTEFKTDPTHETGTLNVVVDAVAQQPEGLAETAAVDGVLGEQNSVTISVQASFKDGEDSNVSDTRHFVLVEAKPGFAVDGAETVFVEGQAYFRVDVTGQTPGPNYEVTLRLTDPSLGDGKETFKTGAMSMETGTDKDNNPLIGGADNSGDLEWRTDNNVGVKFNDKPCEVEISLVKSHPSIGVSPVYEHGDGDGATSGVITISGMEGVGTTGGQDLLTELTLKVGSGDLLYNGTVITNNSQIDGLKFTVDGDGKVTVTSADPSKTIPLKGFSYKSTEYDSADVGLTWSAKVKDPLSGDIKDFGTTAPIVVDAVAQAPSQTVQGFGSEDGHEAASAGEKASVTTTLTFDDAAGNEEHYAVLAHNNNWVCTGVTINGTEYPVTTMYSSNGQPFYGYKIPNSLLANGSVEVTFNVTAPKVTTDISNTLKVGGFSFEPDTGVGDKEITLSNNWKETLDDVALEVGVLETTQGDFSLAAATTNEDTAVALNLNVAGLAAHNEFISELSFTLPAGAKLRYDGTEVSGSLSFTNGAPFDSSKLTFEPPANSSGPFTLGYNATVTDAASGDSKNFNGTGNVTVTAVADAPTNISATDIPTDAVTAGGSVTFTVSAEFTDIDGSEQHFVLVEAKTGWTCAKSAGTYTDPATQVEYFKIPVSNNTAGSPSVSVTLTAPNTVSDAAAVSFKTGGLSIESSNNSTAFAAGAVADIPVYFKAELSVTPPTGAAATEGGTLLTLSLMQGQQAMISAEAAVLSFVVTGLVISSEAYAAQFDANGDYAAGNGITWHYDSMSGNYEVSVNLAAGQGSIDIPAPQFGMNGIIDAPQNIDVDNLSVTGVDGLTASPLSTQITVVDADYAAATGYGHDASLLTAGAHVVDASHGYTGTDAGETILGTDAADTIHGGGGNDVIHGGAGDDLIYGGTGNDTLTGGAGADTFAWKAGDMGGTDTITDFNQSEGDKLRFEDLFGSGGETTLNNLLNSGTWEANPEGSSTGTFSAVNGSNSISLHLDGTNASLTVSGDTGSQTVALNNFAPDLTSGSETQQIHDMLQQIIKVTE